jgi:alginate O-acetyltransferase complex protein AlgI
MLFNSIEFAFFLPIVFWLYWFVFHRTSRSQNILLIISSYVFYGWWDWRYLFLLIASSFADFCFGVGLGTIEKPLTRKVLFYSSIVINLGVLCFFKYYNFFVDSFVSAFTFFGYHPNYYTLQVILPVGISFYTFQSMSYTIDVYRKKIEPTRDAVSFMAFVAFFPQLVAGPIERATNLLPQFYKRRSFTYTNAVDGMRQSLWGLFKKVVVADSCAPYVNDIFSNYQDYNGSTLLIGTILFSFQIYCDFSGYSDIALGTAKLFGFTLMRNFALPYFSRDIAEFWRRWHISLSTWFKDYVYIPLGGSRGGTLLSIRNTFIVFLLSGLWHGANWTFVLWGVFHACCFLPLLLLKQNRAHTDTVASNRMLPSVKEFFQIIITFALVSFAWIFFRAQTLETAVGYIARLLSDSLFGIPEIVPFHIFFLIGVLISAEWMTRTKPHPLNFEKTNMPRPVRWAIYNFVLLVIVFFWGSQQEFIYFQF